MKPTEVEGLLRAAASRIALSSQEATRSLSQVASRLQASAHGAGVESERPVAEEDLEQAVARVREALAAGEEGTIRRRDARLAIGCFQRFAVDELATVLSACPLLWTSWVRRFFADRLDMSVPDEAAWASLLREAPGDVRLLDDTLSRRLLLMPDGYESATMLAGSLPESVPLRLALQAVTAPGLLDFRWKYTAVVLATIASQPNRAMVETWEAVKEDRRLEAMLVPPRRPLGASWFASTVDRSRPMLEKSDEAHARFAASLLRHEQARPSAADGIPWRMILFESEFRDPREFADPRTRPETPGWQRVKKLAPVHYNNFIDTLLNEDVSLFFSAVQMDPARKAFWQRYVSAASATVFFLSRATRDHLRQQFASADDSIRSVLRRARNLRDNRVNAFAMKFGEHVAVEFSETGNAAYLYTTESFEQLTVDDGNLRTSDLKNKALGLAFSHAGDWEGRLEARLRAVGVFPIRR